VSGPALKPPAGVTVLFDEPLAGWTSFGIGGPAEILCLPTDEDQLRQVLDWARQAGRPVTVLGGGSNVLISDRGVPGLVIILRQGFDRISHQPLGPEEVLIRAGAGFSSGRLVSLAGEHGWLDLAFLAGVPGSIGGAAVVNAGAAEGWMSDVVQGLRVLNGQGRSRRLDRAELDYTYRCLRLDPDKIVVEVELKSRLAEPGTVSQMIGRWLKRRRVRQPGGAGSAGCFFKNPPRDSAGRLIEAVGLKGRRCGAAMISDVHANFIVNLGRARAADVMVLAERARTEVWIRFGIELEPEVRFLGRGREKWPWL